MFPDTRLLTRGPSSIILWPSVTWAVWTPPPQLPRNSKVAQPTIKEAACPFIMFLLSYSRASLLPFCSPSPHSLPFSMWPWPASTSLHFSLSLPFYNKCLKTMDWTGSSHWYPPCWSNGAGFPLESQASNLLPGDLPALQPQPPAKPTCLPSKPPELARLTPPDNNLPPELSSYPFQPLGQSLPKGPYFVLSSSATYSGVWNIQEWEPDVPGLRAAQGPHNWLSCGAQQGLWCLRVRAQLLQQFRRNPRLYPFLTPGVGSRGFLQSNACLVVLWGPQCSQTSLVQHCPVILALSRHGTPFFVPQILCIFLSFIKSLF